MAPTRMKLRVRRREAAGGGAPSLEEEERRRESGGRSSRRKTSSTSAAAAAAASPPSCSTAARAAAVAAAEEASPDSKCPICLDRFNNLAYLDRCLHRFCFPCIQEWSHNKAECPLCKQPFASILHSVRAEDDFKEYTLRPPPANSSVAAAVAMVAAMASAARSDHRIRSMLRRRGAADGGAEDGGGAEGPAEAAERGVMFQGLMGLRRPRTHADRTFWNPSAGLALRRRLQQEGGAARRLRESETVAFRRSLYRYDMRVRGVAGLGDGERAQQGDVSAEGFRRNPALLNRLRPWLRRELTVLYGPQRTLVDIVQRIVVAQLAAHGLEDSPIEDELRPFLLARTAHFLHELAAFARSPLSLENYDLQAAYEPPPAALELDELSSASDGSSVIAISEGEDERPGGGAGAEPPAGGGAGAPEDAARTGSCLSLSVWDDETPGPSHSSAEPSRSLAPDSAPQEAEKAQDGEEECLIVGYKKPIAERTPELVHLSSDTEDDKEEAERAPPPAADPDPTLPIPASTSAAAADEKETEAPARPWSASSGRSLESVCALGPGERRPDTRRDRKRWSGDGAREKRRRRKRRRGRDRSGTLAHPKRSAGSALTWRRSPSPLPSGAASSSPPESSWGYDSSPLSSRASSPLCLSPPLSSPQPETPPSPSRGDAHHGEKPGGKRKYKSRHLDGGDKDETWTPSGGRRPEGGGGRSRRGRSQERRGRDARRRGGSADRSREVRSPSVEIIYEGTVASGAAPPPRRRHRTRPRKRRRKSSSPVVITLDSDSSHDNVNNKMAAGGGSSSSSPLSSQQTVDFCDLPPLPLVSSAGVGGAIDPDIGELPVDILDGGSDVSGAEPGWSDADHLDVEKVEDVRGEDDGPMGELRRTAAVGAEGGVAAATRLPPIHPEVCDTRLLATILDELEGAASPRPRPRRAARDWPAEPGVADACSGSAPPPPPLHQMPLGQAPPLLRSTSPVRAPNRNTPPPLKHKDAGSPRPSPRPPADPAPAAQVIPPISTLKKPPRADAPPRLDLVNSFHWSEQRSSCDVTWEAPPSPLRPPPVPFGPAVVGSSKETPPLCNSTSGGHRTAASTSCGAAPVDFLVSGGGAAGVSPSGGAVFSGVNSKDPWVRGSDGGPSRAADVGAAVPVNRDDASPPHRFDRLGRSPPTERVPPPLDACDPRPRPAPWPHRTARRPEPAPAKRSGDDKHNDRLDPVGLRLTSSLQNQWDSSPDTRPDSGADGRRPEAEGAEPVSRLNDSARAL